MNRSARASGASPAGEPSTLNINKLCEQYVALRDRKRVMESEHKAALAPYNKIMGELESKMLGYLQQAGIDHVATPSGTAYQITKPSATIRDGAAFRQWVVETASYQIVDWRANANAVSDFIADNDGTIPPGVNYSTRTSVNFRRPNEKE
jgi:hypothetical protein